MKNFALCLVALSMLAVLPACSKAIKTEGVAGVITYNGEPLADATVKFIPTDATGSQSYGKTNEKGEYNRILLRIPNRMYRLQSFHYRP